MLITISLIGDLAPLEDEPLEEQAATAVTARAAVAVAASGRRSRDIRPKPPPLTPRVMFFPIIRIPDRLPVEQPARRLIYIGNE
ncbi:hypothetical protein [Frankia canadensis]|uniref:hypothetical protein n=1 Tax=Frankia canadensis TaxID=1836972 RepID=UPI001403AFEA|nr:hypothetical protein [Frankia canadensis]